MRILLLCHSFNSLTQRLFIELTRTGHELSVEFDIHDSVTEEAVALFRPEVVLAPFLKRAIPASVWSQLPCLIVHPGIAGDRGPSALDWAITQGVTEWGVTVLQAEADLDGGPMMATVNFPMRTASKSSLYRHEVTDAACLAVMQALQRLQLGEPGKRVAGTWRPLMRQSDRIIDWQRHTTEQVLNRIHAADGTPGVADQIAGLPVYLYDVHPEDKLRGEPGTLLAQHQGAICRATVDGAVWIGQLRATGAGPLALKRPAMDVLGARASDLPKHNVLLEDRLEHQTYRDIIYDEQNDVGYLYFPFHNGAMGRRHCERLLEAYQYVRRRPVKVIALMGGEDFFSNGIHLHLIEAAASPADESWHTINAMNDLVREILITDRQLVISALRGNAGAGGVFLALAADKVVAHSGVVLNPHYRNMGNLYGSEYWTYALPKRLGTNGARRLMADRLPLGAPEALHMGLIDASFDSRAEALDADIHHYAQALANNPDYHRQLEAKCQRRQQDEASKALSTWREEELAQMHLNFYGFDPSYHVARYNFVYRRPHAWTPLYLARHRKSRGG